MPSQMRLSHRVIRSCIMIGMSLAVLLVTSTIMEVFTVEAMGSTSSPLCDAHWQSVGPFSIQPGDLSYPIGIGAATQLWVHEDTAYVGTVNGGVWRTNTFHTYDAFEGPHWEPTTDQSPCNSITALSASNDDSLTVIAGCGHPSNGGSVSGEARGVIVTHDGGDTWASMNALQGYYIGGVLVSGSGTTADILVSTAECEKPRSGTTNQVTDPYGLGTCVLGIWRSTHFSVFTHVQRSNYSVNSLARHPSTPTTIFASRLVTVAAAHTPSSIMQSTDGGTTWGSLPSEPSFIEDCSMAVTQSLLNMKLTLATQNGVTRMYVGYYTTNCYAIYYTDNGGVTWDRVTGLPSATILGNQGDPNFALFTDSLDPSILFVAATGNVVYRGNVDAVPEEWFVISTVRGTDPPLPYSATASGTAPHADARYFWYDTTNDELLLTADGGLYSRSNPFLTPDEGDWKALNGDMSSTEVYNVGVDYRTGAMIITAQDNSIMVSQVDGKEAITGIWSIGPSGDGATLGVDDSQDPTVFFGAVQFLGNFFSLPVLGGESDLGTSGIKVFPTTNIRCPTGTLDDDTCLAFGRDIAVNLIYPSNFIICTLLYVNTLRESLDGSICTIASFAPGSRSSELEFDPSVLAPGQGVFKAFIFGGRKDNQANEFVVFALGDSVVWARDSNDCWDSSCITLYDGSCDLPLCTLGSSINTSPPWLQLGENLLAQHPQDYYINVVTDFYNHNWITVDFGQSWLDLNLPENSNLLEVSGHKSVDTFHQCAVIFINNQIDDVHPLVIATPLGVFVSFTVPAEIDAETYYTFIPLGVNMANVVPSDLSYDPHFDTLTLATFGRGVWQLQNASLVLQLASLGHLPTPDDNCLLPLYPNVENSYYYDPSLLPPDEPGSESDSAALMQFHINIDPALVGTGLTDEQYSSQMQSALVDQLNLNSRPSRLGLFLEKHPSSTILITVLISASVYPGEPEAHIVSSDLVTLINTPVVGSSLYHDALLKFIIPGSATVLEEPAEPIIINTTTSSSFNWPGLAIAIVVLLVLIFITLCVWAGVRFYQYRNTPTPLNNPSVSSSQSAASAWRGESRERGFTVNPALSNNSERMDSPSMHGVDQTAIDVQMEGGSKKGPSPVEMQARSPRGTITQLSAV